MPNIEITATGNVSGAVSALDKLDGTLKKVSGGQINILRAQLERLQKIASLPDLSFKQSERLNSLLSKTSAELQKADKGLRSVVPGANQATFAITNFGRVIQDAPFGIIGITNNINPLLESFQRLKAETGSTGGALKALAGSLIGAGGLGLAVSIVSGLLTIFALNNRSAGGSVEDLSGNLSALKADFDAANVALDEFNKSTDALKSLRDINLKRLLPDIKGAADDLKRLNIGFGFNKQEEEEKLRELLRIETVAEERRAKTFSLLQQKGSDALISLTAKYNILNDVKKSGNDLSSTDIKLLDAAISAENDKFKIISDQNIQRIRINSLISQNKIDIDEINEKEKQRVKNLLTIGNVLEQLRLELSFLAAKELTFKTDESKAKISEINKAIETLVTKLNVDPKGGLIKRLFGDISDLELPLLQKIVSDIARQVRLTVPVYFDEDQMMVSLSNALKSVEKKGIKEGTSVFGNIDLELKTAVRIDPNVTKESLTKELGSFGVKEVLRTLENGLKIKIPIEIATTTELLAALAKVEAEFESFSQRINSILESMVEDSITGLGESIGEALAVGELPRLFDGIISNLGGQLKELGKFLVQTGVIMEAAKKALKALFANPVAQVIAGVALVALGSFLQASVRKKNPGFAAGGTVGQSGFYNVGERGQERVFLPQGSRVQPNNEVSAYGGGVVLQPSIHYEGTGFRIMLNRVDAHMGRNN